MNRVLIIDDEVEIVSLLTRFFKKNNFEVHSSHSLNKGKSIYSQHQFHLLILDINLKDGNGLEELNYFTTHNNECKIFMISALDSDDVKSKALANGAYAFFSKPFNASDILQLIHQNTV